MPTGAHCSILKSTAHPSSNAYPALMPVASRMAPYEVRTYGEQKKLLRPKPQIIPAAVSFFEPASSRIEKRLR